MKIMGMLLGMLANPDISNEGGGLFKIAESEQKQRISALKETESGQMYGCCSGYEF